MHVYAFFFFFSLQQGTKILSIFGEARSCRSVTHALRARRRRTSARAPSKNRPCPKAVPQEKRGKPPEENRGNSGQLLAARASALGLNRAGSAGAQVDRHGGAAALRGWAGRGGSPFPEVGGGGRSRSLHVPTGVIHGVTCELKLGER